MSSDAAFDVAIVGGGTIGLSAAWYAASAGYRTVLFEQYDFYNDKGSSDGESRMFRVMYSDLVMARLAETSLGLWQEIEHFTGQQLLVRKGLLFYGLPADSVEGDLQQCEKVMKTLGIPFDRYARDGLLQAYPVFRDLPQEYFGLSQPSGASIMVQKSLRTFHDLAQKNRVALLSKSPAVIGKASPGATQFTIRSRGATFTAKHVILCPGAWSNYSLASFGFQFDLKIWQMTVAYYPVDPSLPWPMWYEFGPTVGQRELLYYGFPADEIPGHIKISADFTNDIYDDPKQCTYKPDQSILDDMSTFLPKRFKGVTPTPQQAVTCLYTMSPDAQIILGNLPGFPNVAVCSGESGRGFKYTPLFGRILVQLATTGKCSYDISEFRVDRKGIIRKGC
jgi:monomeric sarcosine oxidase